MYSLLLIILILCLLMLPIYFRTTRFTGFWGIALFISGITALVIRFYLISWGFPVLGLYNAEYFTPALLVTLAPTLVFMFFGYISGNFWRRKRRLEKLIVPYVFFGGLQQIFFLWVFTDTVYYLTRSMLVAFIASFLFFYAFHLAKSSSIKKFKFLLIVFGALNAWVYLIWGNSLPQVLTHGLVGSILFTEFTNHDEIKDRLG